MKEIIIIKIIILFLFTISSPIYCLENERIEKELLKEVENQESTLITGLRQKVLRKLIKKEYKRVEELLDYKNKKFPKDSYIIFWPIEMDIINFWLSRFKYFLDFEDLEKKRNKAYRRHYSFIEPTKDYIYKELIEFTENNYFKIEKRLNKSKLSQEQKDYIRLFIDNLLYKNDGNLLAFDRLKENTEKFEKTYANSKYKNFIYKWIKQRWGLRAGFGINIGYSNLTDKLQDNFTNVLPIGLEFEMSKSKIVGLFRANIMVASRIKKDINANLFLAENESAFYNSFDFYLGYKILENRNFGLTPFIGIAAGTFSVSLNNNSYNILNRGIGYSLGVFYDLKLADRTFNLAFLMYTIQTLRITLNYTKPNFGNDNKKFPGKIITLSMGYNLISDGYY